MQTYVTESYVPRSRAPEARAAGRRARAAAEQLTAQGSAVRYVRTTFLPDDETCFHVFEAPSAEVVLELVRRAGLGSVRVARAIEASRPKRLQGRAAP